MSKDQLSDGTTGFWQDLWSTLEYFSGVYANEDLENDQLNLQSELLTDQVRGYDSQSELSTNQVQEVEESFRSEVQRPVDSLQSQSLDMSELEETVTPEKSLIHVMKNSEAVVDYQKIPLTGRALFESLKSDVELYFDSENRNFNKESFAEHVKERFNKTILSVLTGIDHRDLLQDDSTLQNSHEQLMIANTINLAVDQLAKELDRENKEGVFWNYQNSIDRAAQKRWAINFVGKVYDTIGSICHNVGVKLGILDKNAADLFSDAAKLAKKDFERLNLAQITRNTNFAAEAEKNSDYASLKRRGFASQKDVEEKREKLLKKKYDLTYEVLHQQLPKEQAEIIAAKENNTSYEYSAEERYESFNRLDNYIKSLVEIGRGEKNQDIDLRSKINHEKDNLQKAGLFTAMREVEASLFPGIVTTQRHYENLTAAQDISKYEVKKGEKYDYVENSPQVALNIDRKKVYEAVSKLEKAVKKAGNKTMTERFADFKTEVSFKVKPITFTERVLSSNTIIERSR